MINRRDFLLGGIALSNGFSFVHAKNISNNAHVVIIGAGWGGLSFAKTLRYLDKNCKITIIDKQNKFVSCPMSNWVIGQIKNMSDITFSFEDFARNQEIQVINDEVKLIDTFKKKISLKKYTLNYDKLVISPGIEMNIDSVIGLKEAYDGKRVLSAWKAGKETSVLSKMVKNIVDGQNIVISIPLSPYRCPPGPYERASLIADHIKTNKISSKVIILDANQKIISKRNLFKKAWDDYYKDIIEYYPDSRVIEINGKEKKVYTDFDEYKYDIANIIPKQQAPNFLKTSGLVEKNRSWAKVNSRDFSSHISNDVYILGDSTDRSTVGSVPKSGYIAYSMGKTTAFSVYFSLLGKPSPPPRIINTCYSLVSKKEGISVSAIYKYSKEKDRIISVKNASGTSPFRSNLIAKNAWDWAQSIWADMLT